MQTVLPCVNNKPHFIHLTKPTHTLCYNNKDGLGGTVECAPLSGPRPLVNHRYLEDCLGLVLL